MKVEAKMKITNFKTVTFSTGKAVELTEEEWNELVTHVTKPSPVQQVPGISWPTPIPFKVTDTYKKMLEESKDNNTAFPTITSQFPLRC